MYVSSTRIFVGSGGMPLGRKYKTFHLAEKRFLLAEKYLAYLLYGSVASLLSPSSNIEAWPYGTSLRFVAAFRALGVCEHS